MLLYSKPIIMVGDRDEGYIITEKNNTSQINVIKIFQNVNTCNYGYRGPNTSSPFRMFISL